MHGLYLVGIMGENPGIDLDALALLGNKLRVQGVYMGSSNLKRDVPLYAQMSLQGRFNLKDLVSSSDLSVRFRPAAGPVADSGARDLVADPR